MNNVLCNSSSSSSASSSVAQPTSPKSPPAVGMDLYGKRRQMVKVQILEREIGVLQEELKSLEGLQPASRNCKELDDFIGAKPDPFIATQEIRKSCDSLHFWKRLCLPWLCCFSSCRLHRELPKCCACCPSYDSCWHVCGCLENICRKCCKFLGLSCPHCSCCCSKLSFCNCTKVNLCSNCAKTCNNPCCL